AKQLLRKKMFLFRMNIALLIKLKKTMFFLFAGVGVIGKSCEVKAEMRLGENTSLHFLVLKLKCGVWDRGV
ncbi:MAG: hypothetical protein QGI53_08795, partial [SAR324 cluster bacterium]|nr:hypothetical protein [SAR324 cluster bacterium]